MTCFVNNIVFANLAASRSFPFFVVIIVSSSSIVLSSIPTMKLWGSILSSSRQMSTFVLTQSTRKLVSSKMVFMV